MAHRVGLDQKTVIQTAADLADKSGLEEVTLATLADRLGISAPTLYHYVNGLSGLRNALAVLGARELARVLGQAVMGRSDGEAIEALAHAYRAFAEAHPGLYNALQRAASPDDIALREAGAEVVEVALRVLAPYQSERNDAIHIVRLWRSMLHGFVSLEMIGGFGLPQEIDETFRRLVKAMIRLVDAE